MGLDGAADKDATDVGFGADAIKNLEKLLAPLRRWVDGGGHDRATC